MLVHISLQIIPSSYTQQPKNGPKYVVWGRRCYIYMYILYIYIPKKTYIDIINLCAHTHTHTHTYIHMYINDIYIYISKHLKFHLKRCMTNSGIKHVSSPELNDLLAKMCAGQISKRFYLPNYMVLLFPNVPIVRLLVSCAAP